MDIKQLELRMVIGTLLLMAFVTIWNAIKRRQAIKRFKEEYATSEEKSAIVDSKIGPKSKRDIKGGFFAFLIVLTFVILAAGIIYFKKTDLSVSIWIIIAALILSLITIKSYSKNHTNYKQKDLYSTLVDMYKEVKVLPVNPPTKIPVSNDAGKEIQVINNSCYSIPMYNCVLSSNTLFMEKETVYGNGKVVQTNEPVSTHIQYAYTLNKTVPDDILNSDADIHRTISEISKNKFASFHVVNNCLLVDKETMLHNYTDEAREIDCRDVEYFYNTVVRKILEKNF